MHVRLAFQDRGIGADCGGVSELENEAILQTLQSAAETTGFETKRPVVEVWGTCAQCSRKLHDAGL